MKKAISLFVVLAILISVTAVVFAYNKKGEELLISKDNISYNISDNLYGVSLEDVNCAIDGGLSSNLVNNNSFEYESDRLFAWNIDAVSYSVQGKEGLNKVNRNYLSVTVDGEGSIKNNGYTEIYDYNTYNYNEEKKNTPDMGFKKNEKYEFSAFFKNVSFDGEITVSLQANGNTETYKFNLDGYDEWTKVIFQIESNVTADGGLLISTKGTGTFLMDYVTLVPIESHGFYGEEWKYSSVRTDLYDTIKGLSPKFIRFPGTVVSKGNSIEKRYSWKNTIGPLEERVQTLNPWSNSAEGRNYNSSNFVGYYEYFMLCKELNASPIPAVGAGITVTSYESFSKTQGEYENGVLTESEWQDYIESIAITPESPEWDAYIADILDLIEFANGKSDTEWGKERAENGSEEPFNMKYLEIDSEISGDIYWKNFDGIYKAVKEAYPEIILIASPGVDVDSDEFKKIKTRLSTEYPDVMLGESFTSENGQLFGSTRRYDSYERGGAKTAVNEWSVKSNGYGAVQTGNNIWSAIEEASYLTGVERNADAVGMISYAPLFSKVSAQSTNSNLVWFDSQELVLTPDYYTQMLFANNLGTNIVSTNLNMEQQGIYESVTVDTEQKVIYVKLVNKNAKSVDLTLNVGGFGDVKSASNQYMSEVFKAACNEIGGTLHVAPNEKTYNFKENKLNFTVEGLSVNVIRIPYEDSTVELYALPKIELVTPFIHPTIKLAIPCVIIALLIITGITVLVNRYTIKRRIKDNTEEEKKKKEKKKKEKNKKEKTE